MEILLNGVKPLNILACICKVAVMLGLMSVLLKEHFTVPDAIFLHSSGVNEIALLNLQETYSLSVLMYDLERPLTVE